MAGAVHTDAHGPALSADRQKCPLYPQTALLRVRATSMAFRLPALPVHPAGRDLLSPNPNVLSAVGEAHSAGLEVDVSGKLTERLRLISSYAFTEPSSARTTTACKDS
jgi:outer membrane receptor for ferric coprogen and ferric-rhodotorulic acid